METARRKFDRFQKGSAVFPCTQCGKHTRETGEGESQLKLCKRCIFEVYVENAASDYGEGSEEHLSAIARLKALGQ